MSPAGTGACNGWTYWHCRDPDKRDWHPIDLLRRPLIANEMGLKLGIRSSQGGNALAKTVAMAPQRPAMGVATPVRALAVSARALSRQRQGQNA